MPTGVTLFTQHSSVPKGKAPFYIRGGSTTLLKSSPHQQESQACPHSWSWKGSWPADALTATTEQPGEIPVLRPSFQSCLTHTALWSKSGRGEETCCKEITEESECGGFIWVKQFIHAGSTLLGREVVPAAFWFVLQKQWSVLGAAQAFRSILVHRGSFCNLRVLNAGGFPLTGRKPDGNQPSQM